MFEVGEIALFICDLAPDGVEREVIGAYAWRTFRAPCDFTGATGGYCYLIMKSFGPACAWPWQLRKKKPPREDLQLVRWSECPWQPESINV
jgi:hypothetical protein